MLSGYFLVVHCMRHAPVPKVCTCCTTIVPGHCHFRPLFSLLKIPNPWLICQHSLGYQSWLCQGGFALAAMSGF